MTIEDLIEIGTSIDGIPYIKFKCRVGILTDFWAKKVLGQGATFSVGTDIDRYAIYAEIDKVSCPDFPSTAIYGAVVAPNSLQKNLAFEAHAENAAKGNIAYYGDVQFSPEADDKLTPIIIGEMVDGVVTRTKVFSFE